MPVQHIVDIECDLDIYQCLDCGAHAVHEEDLAHHASCKEGESEYWERFYAENPDD